MRRHPGQADVVVDEGELLRVAVVQDDGTEDGVRDGRGLGLQEVDGVPRGAGLGKLEGEPLVREEEDAAQAEVGAGV